MKFKGKFDADCIDVASSRGNAMSCAGKRKSHVEEDDMVLDDDYVDGDGDGDDDLDTDSLLDQFDDDIEGVDLSDLDLEDFAGEFGDDDDEEDDFDDDFDDDDSPRSGKRRHRDDDDDDIYDEDEIDDSAFYNDEFKDFDNYTTISDFDDDLDSYIQNEDGGFYDDYDSRY